MGELEDGTVLAEWLLRTVDDEPDMVIKIGFEVAFTDTAGQLDGKSVIVVCEVLAAGVERTIFHYLSGTLT